MSEIIQKKWVVRETEDTFSTYESEEEARQICKERNEEDGENNYTCEEKEVSRFKCDGCGEDLTWGEDYTEVATDCSEAAEEDMENNDVLVGEGFHFCPNCVEECEHLKLIAEQAKKIAELKEGIKICHRCLELTLRSNKALTQQDLDVNFKATTGFIAGPDTFEE